MPRYENPQEYYDSFYKRRMENSWWRIVLRYLGAALAFILVMGIVLSSYWFWLDYKDQGWSSLNWENYKANVKFRWNEFKAVRFHLCGEYC